MITFRIRGTVTVAETGVGLPGLFVKAYDKDLLFDDLLGSTYTKEDGRFEIISDADDFRDFFEVKPDIYLKIYSPDAETLLFSTEKAVRWQAGRLEEFDVRIPRDSLGGLVPESRVHLLDDNGEKRSDFDIGESLTVRIEGVAARSSYDLVLFDENGEVLFTSSLSSDRSGTIDSATIWAQAGLDDPHSTKRFSVEQAQKTWQGRALRLEVRASGKKVLEQAIKFADVLTRPLLLSTDNDGVVLNGFEIGERAAVVSGYNLPFHGTVRVFMVARQHDWLPGNPFAPVRLASGRPAVMDLQLAETQRNFSTRIARARELRPGAYDFIVRQLRYGYEDDEDLVLRDTDLVTRRVTGLVVREKFMPSKAVLGGCANTQPISGRIIPGAPYFRFADTFQVGESIYAALDPAALDPALISKMVALYVVKRPVANYQSLQHLPVLGGNAAVKRIKTQSTCINHNALVIWPNPSAADAGEYDIVADFGNNTGDAAAFTPDASFDQPLDIVDGYFTPGFRVVPDPTTDTDPNIDDFGTWSYTESDYGSKTVPDDGDLGSPVTVPMRAYVRFPADSAGVTDPLQISTEYANYPMIVAVHGNGHDYGNYNYLLEHWAKNGFIAASIHLTSGMGGIGRARILFEHLTILKNKLGLKAANNIGIMGHSRGGEAVVIAARLNQQEGLGHNINAIISLSPTDRYTHESLGGTWATPYFVLYGAMDGDVAGGSGMPWRTGFALYDRAGGAKKSMVFVYGATHDRFNLVNPDADFYFGKIGPTDQSRILSAATHQTIAKAYMTAFFRWQLKNQAQWEGIFKGEWVPAAVAQAEPDKARLCVQYGDTTTTVVDDFEEAHTPTSWQDSTIAGSVDDGNTLPEDPLEDELYDVDTHSPHDTSGLLLHWDGTSDKLEFKPDSPINVTAFQAVSFRVTQKVDGDNPADQAQDMYLTLTDTNNKRRAIKVSKFGEIPAPQKRHYNQYTKSAMCTIRIPLHVFKTEVIGTDKVDLQNVKTLGFEFKAKPKGEVEIDSIEFSN
jgi:hypothetical protein